MLEIVTFSRNNKSSQILFSQTNRQTSNDWYCNCLNTLSNCSSACEFKEQQMLWVQWNCSANFKHFAVHLSMFRVPFLFLKSFPCDDIVFCTVSVLRIFGESLEILWKFHTTRSSVVYSSWFSHKIHCKWYSRASQVISNFLFGISSPKWHTLSSYCLKTWSSFASQADEILIIIKIIFNIVMDVTKNLNNFILLIDGWSVVSILWVPPPFQVKQKFALW